MHQRTIEVITAELGIAFDGAADPSEKQDSGPVN
jgi:hypothetical protein